jgi:hypothetical protein
MSLGASGGQHWAQTEALVEDVLARSDARKRERVSALWSVLRAMRKKGLVEFTIAAVGRECERAGFLKTQSIRNDAGADYLKIIKTFRGEIGAEVGSRPLKNGERSPVEQFINTIGDVQVKVRLLEMIETTRRQAVEIARLRNGYKHVVQPVPLKGQESAANQLKQRRKAEDWTPLDKFISSEWCDTHGFEITERGALYTAEGDRLTPDGFMACLGEALRRAKSEC